MSRVVLSPSDPVPAPVRHLWRRPQTGTYYARVRLPPGLGRGDHLQESLRTKHHPEALRRLPVVVGRLLAERERLSREPSGVPKGRPKGPPRETSKWADWWRREVIVRGGDPDRGDVPLDLEVTLDEEIERRLGLPIGEEVDSGGMLTPVYDEGREADALELAAVARGVRSPIAAELHRFLAETRTRKRTQSRTRLAVGRLVAWRRRRVGGDDLKAVDRREAGLFVDHLLAQGLTTATANSMVTAVSSYWRWMEKRGATAGNPWRDQGRRRTEAEEEREVRGFTESEVVKLLSGVTTRTMHDLMRLGALTGARINELASLQVSDAAGGVFNIRRSKTQAGVRTVPIHSQLAELVARRTEGQPADAYLFHELKAPTSRPDERSAKASERFTEYRREVGVDERTDGQRNSDVNFHSWRHWFVSEALRAGHEPHIVSAVVGHKAGRQSVTLKVYDRGGPSLEQRRAVVESVRLPEGVSAESPVGPLMNSGARGKGRRPTAG